MTNKLTNSALLALSTSILLGCSQSTQPSDVALAEEMCSTRGGFTNVSRYSHGYNIIMVCKNGVIVDVTLPKKD